MTKDFRIRSSAAEFLIFSNQTGGNDIDVIYDDETLWITQSMMGLLFNVEANTITYHLGQIYKSEELEREATTRKFRVVRQEGNRKVERDIEHFNLDAIISVGYRINSKQATQFRRWATQILSTYTKQGYILDRARMENGSFFNEDYFKNLLEEIREIRLSERQFYQKLTDIYATSYDYDQASPITKEFFAKCQNKMHYAVSGQTAAEIIYARANSEKEHMGLTSWKNAPTGKIIKSDVSIAKNYLNKSELSDLGRIVSAFLDLAEGRAERGIPMSMQDWADRIDIFLKADDRDILLIPGRISMADAKEFAESEYKKYRVIQDRIYQSDYDKLLQDSQRKNKKSH